MTSSSSQNTLNNFHRFAQDIQSDYINPRIIRKLKTLNAIGSDRCLITTSKGGI